MKAGVGPQIERIFHFIERWRYTALLHPLVNEHQQFVLLASEHGALGGFGTKTEHGVRVLVMSH